MAKNPLKDELPWIELAEQILRGRRKIPPEGSERDSMLIGLRAVKHPKTEEAAKLLGKKK